MSNLINSTGHLNGVKLSYSIDSYNEWSFGHRVVGWVVQSNKKDKFNLNFEIEGRQVEMQLSRKALRNMLNALGA